MVSDKYVVLIPARGGSKSIKLKNIKVIGYSDIDPYILKDLNKYNLQIINQKSGTLEPIVHEFVSQTDEITYVAIDIIKKIKEEKVNINDIYISGITEEYKSELIRIFNLFKVPFSFNKKNSLYSTPIVQTFIKNIKKSLYKTTMEKAKKKLFILLCKNIT